MLSEPDFEKGERGRKTPLVRTEREARTPLRAEEVNVVFETHPKILTAEFHFQNFENEKKKKKKVQIAKKFA